MAKLKTKLLILAVLGVVLAIFYPKIKSAYGKHIKPHADIAANVVKFIKDFHIFGYHIPWKYVLPGFALFLAVQLFRVSIIVQTFSSIMLLIFRSNFNKLKLNLGLIFVYSQSATQFSSAVKIVFFSPRVLSIWVYCVDLQKRSETANG